MNRLVLILAYLALRCTPLPLPPGEEETWRRNNDRRESWAPCEKRFNVPWTDAERFTRDARARCDGGQGAACAQMAFVERDGCQMFADPQLASDFAGRACALRELSGCQLQRQLCDSGTIRCADGGRSGPADGTRAHE